LRFSAGQHRRFILCWKRRFINDSYGWSGFNGRLLVNWRIFDCRQYLEFRRWYNWRNGYYRRHINRRRIKFSRWRQRNLHGLRKFMYYW
jgi:hypothetical protein